MGTLIATAGLAVYVLLLLALLAYGLNSFVLVAIHRWHRRNAPPAPPPPEERPFVTVQLPVYNEENVVERLLHAAAALRWPKDRFEIQLLDDSTDATSAIAARAIAALRAEGIEAFHIRRTARDGYKAGALAAGLVDARGDLIAIFDADFVPPPDFLERASGRFGDPSVAVVQGRWAHLNREASMLTRAQAIAIDAHFGVEQGARCWASWFLNFNGSAGVWRRSAIVAAGGWTGDTLTEDLDLSYRAQLAGWKIVYDPDLACPGELPADLAAFKSQQRRWAIGSMQTARKLLGRVWRSRASFGAKWQASLHLTHYAVHPLIALTALLSVPCVLLPGAAIAPPSLWGLLLPFALAMSGPTMQHAYAQRVLEGRRIRVRELFMLTLLGIGIALSNGKAVIDSFSTRPRPFVRTPKHGVTTQRTYRPERDGLWRLESALALYCAATSAGLVWAGIYVLAPFMLLYALGFAAVARLGWREARA